MKRLIIAITLLAGVVWLSPGAASAAQSGTSCYEQVQVTEFKYIRSIPNVESEYVKEITRTQEQINKETRERRRSSSMVAWGPWSEWTDWPDAGPVWDDGRAREGDHDGTANDTLTKYDRDYRYVVVGSRQVSYTPKRYEYQWSLNTLPAPWKATGNMRQAEPTVEGPTQWLSGPPAEDGYGPWEQVEERTITADGEEIPCPPDPPVTTTTPPVEPPVTTPPVEECTTGVVDENGNCQPVGTPGDDTPPPPPAPPAATTTPPTSLPETGSSSTFIAILAGLALAFGASMIYVSRRGNANIT